MRANKVQDRSSRSARQITDQQSDLGRGNGIQQIPCDSDAQGQGRQGASKLEQATERDTGRDTAGSNRYPTKSEQEIQTPCQSTARNRLASLLPPLTDPGARSRARSPSPATTSKLLLQVRDVSPVSRRSSRESTTTTTQAISPIGTVPSASLAPPSSAVRFPGTRSSREVLDPQAAQTNCQRARTEERGRESRDERPSQYGVSLEARKHQRLVSSPETQRQSMRASVQATTPVWLHQRGDQTSNFGEHPQRPSSISDSLKNSHGLEVVSTPDTSTGGDGSTTNVPLLPRPPMESSRQFSFTDGDDSRNATTSNIASTTIHTPIRSLSADLPEADPSHREDRYPEVVSGDGGLELAPTYPEAVMVFPPAYDGTPRHIPGGSISMGKGTRGHGGMDEKTLPLLPAGTKSCEGYEGEDGGKEGEER